MVRKWIRYIYLAVKDCKLLYYDDYFLMSYHIKKHTFVFWYVDIYGRVRVFDTCEDMDSAKFKWLVLMSRSENAF